MSDRHRAEIAHTTSGAPATGAETAIHNEIDLAQPTALDGTACQAKPKPGETLVLDANDQSNGCTFQDLTKLKRHPHAAEVLKKAKEQTVWVHAFLFEGGAGTGVIAGRNGPNECYVVSDRHVVRGTADEIEHMEELIEQQSGKKQKFIPAINAIAPNGKVYDASFKAEDPATDLALISLHTGKDTDAICHPAKFPTTARSPEPGSEAYTAGFPEQTNALYFSVGANRKNTTLKALANKTTILRDEKQDRTMHEHNLPVRHGNSGGGVYDGDATVIGIESRISNDGKRTFSTPITQPMVDKLIAEGKTDKFKPQ